MINFPFFRYKYPGFYYPYYNNYIKKSYINNNTNQYKEKNNTNYYVNSNNKNSDLVFNNAQKQKSYQTFSRPKDNIENEQYYEQNKKTYTYNSFGPIHFNNSFLNGDFECPIIKILGIELYLDDLILIGLLFLLYNENIQDEMLFISLIMLLLS